MKMSVYRMMEISFLKYNFFMICPSLSKCDFSISYPKKLVKAIQPTVSQGVSTVVCGIQNPNGFLIVGTGVLDGPFEGLRTQTCVKCGGMPQIQCARYEEFLRAKNPSGVLRVKTEAKRSTHRNAMGASFWRALRDSNPRPFGS